MQTLKDEVKQKILDAATEEFLVDGYTNSSLRTIAAQAGITIGNIYSYFSSKEDLFDHVVSPAWEALNSLMNMPMHNGSSHTALLDISTSISQVFVDNKQQFFILLNGSAGTKYQNFRERIEDYISARLQREFAARTEAADPLFVKALTAALFAGFVTLFSHYGGDEQRLNRLVRDLLVALMGDLLALEG